MVLAALALVFIVALVAFRRGLSRGRSRGLARLILLAFATAWGPDNKPAATRKREMARR